MVGQRVREPFYGRAGSDADQRALDDRGGPLSLSFIVVRGMGVEQLMKNEKAKQELSKKGDSF